MPTAKAKFSNINELIADQEDVTVIIEEDPTDTGQFVVNAYINFDGAFLSSQDIFYSYLLACNVMIMGQNLATSAYIFCNSDSYSVWIPPDTSPMTDTYSVPTNFISASHSLHSILV